jgi:hypothetical protein
MKKLFLVALCSMPLLSVARGEEGTTKSGDSMQQGDAAKPDAMNPSDSMGQGSSMEADSAKTSADKAEHPKKRNDEKKMKHDGTGGSRQHDDQMDQGKM